MRQGSAARGTAPSFARGRGGGCCKRCGKRDGRIGVDPTARAMKPRVGHADRVATELADAPTRRKWPSGHAGTPQPPSHPRPPARPQSGATVLAGRAEPATASRPLRPRDAGALLTSSSAHGCLPSPSWSSIDPCRAAPTPRSASQAPAHPRASTRVCLLDPKMSEAEPAPATRRAAPVLRKGQAQPARRWRPPRPARRRGSSAGSRGHGGPQRPGNACNTWGRPRRPHVRNRAGSRSGASRTWLARGARERAKANCEIRRAPAVRQTGTRCCITSS